MDQVLYTCHRRFLKWNRLDIFKKAWIKLLEIYDDLVGINWTGQSIDSISIKAPLGGAMTGHNPTYRSKLGRWVVDEPFHTIC